MATKIYATGNYVKIEVAGESLPRQDSKSNVTIYPVSATEFAVESEKLGKQIFALADLQNESGVAYDATTWEAFYAYYTGFNPATGGSVATGWASYVDTQYTVGSPLALIGGATVKLPNNCGSVIDSQMPPDVDSFYFQRKLNLSNLVGVFEKGETVTGGTSGATGVVLYAGSTYLHLRTVTGTFVDTEEITGGTSAATADVSGAPIGSKITGREGDNLDVMIYFRATPSSINSEIDIWIDIGLPNLLYLQTIYFRATTEKGVLYALPSAYTLNTWQANGGDIYVKPSVNMTVYGMNFNFDRSHKAL